MKEEVRPYFELPSLSQEITSVLRQFDVTPAEMLWSESSHILPVYESDLWWTTDTDPESIQLLKESARSIAAQKNTRSGKTHEMGQTLAPWFEVPPEHFQMSEWQYDIYSDIWEDTINRDGDDDWYKTSLLAAIPVLFPSDIDPLAWEKFDAVYWTVVYEDASDIAAVGKQTFDNAWTELSDSYGEAYRFFHPQPSDDPGENERYQLIRQLKNGTTSPVKFAQVCLEKSAESEEVFEIVEIPPVDEPGLAALLQKMKEEKGLRYPIGKIDRYEMKNNSLHFTVGYSTFDEERFSIDVTYDRMTGRVAIFQLLRHDARKIPRDKLREAYWNWRDAYFDGFDTLSDFVYSDDGNYLFFGYQNPDDRGMDQLVVQFVLREIMKRAPIISRELENTFGGGRG